MVAIPIDAQQWLQGVHLDQYIRTIQTNQLAFQRRLSNVKLSPFEIDQLPMPDCSIKILALSEEWCMDCLMTLPIMHQIASALPDAELRIFSRSKWPELKQYFNQREIMSIPAYAFLNEQMAEFASFVERPRMIDQKVQEWKASHPESDAIRRSATLSSEEKKEKLTQFRLQLQAEMEGWYEIGGQTAMIEEVAALLAKVGSCQKVRA